MGLRGSPEVQIEYVHHRRRRWQPAALLLAFAVMLGVLGLFGVAYAMQADRVEELEAENETILDDHHAIGKKFAEQSNRFVEESRELEEALRASYGQGFLAGRASARLPAQLRTLARYAAAGVLVPRRIPPAAGAGRPRVQKDLDGYTVRWPRLAVFASRTDPLSDWTLQALGGVRPLRLGPYRVQRVIGPSGVIYAWRARNGTYAVLALQTHEDAARALVLSMR